MRFYLRFYVGLYEGSSDAESKKLPDRVISRVLFNSKILLMIMIATFSYHLFSGSSVLDTEPGPFYHYFI